MKKITAFLFFILMSYSSFSQAPIEGHWQPEGEDAIFKIYEDNGKYYGQLIGSHNTEEDRKIKEKEPIILLRDLEKKSDTDFCCGSFISPEHKKEVSARITLLDANTIEFSAKKGPFGKSVIWNRIEM